MVSFGMIISLFVAEAKKFEWVELTTMAFDLSVAERMVIVVGARPSWVVKPAKEVMEEPEQSYAKVVTTPSFAIVEAAN